MRMSSDELDHEPVPALVVAALHRELPLPVSQFHSPSLCSLKVPPGGSWNMDDQHRRLSQHENATFVELLQHLGKATVTTYMVPFSVAIIFSNFLPSLRRYVAAQIL